MLLCVLILLASALVTWGGVREGMNMWLALPVFLLAFAVLNLLAFAFFWLFSLRVDRKKPLEEQVPMCVTGCRLLAQLLCVYGGMRPVFTGLEKLPKDQRFLFVCNHRSLFDPLMVIAHLGDYNISFISKPSNLEIPLAGGIAYAAGYLPIDRENDRAALRSILTAADYLRRGLCSVGIYPEGTRNRGGELLLPFHAGSFKAAQRAGVPVAVACVRGTEKLRHGFFLRPRRCELDILSVIDAQTAKAMSTQELSDTCRGLIAARLVECGEKPEGKAD